MYTKSLKYLLTAIFACFLFSCQTSRHVSNADVLIPQPESSVWSASTNSWIENNLELDRIVQIETSERYVMGNLFRRVIIYQDKIILLDSGNHNVFVVNAYTGKVETYINRKGRGPGESRHILDIAFDDKNEHILVYNDYQNLLYFSLDGEFIKQEKVNEKLYTDIVFNNGELIFYDGSGTYSYPFLIDIFNLTNRTWRTIGTDQKVDFSMRLTNPSMVKSKNIWFVPILDSGLHLLDGDSITVPYGLDLKSPMTNEMLRRYQRTGDHVPISNAARERGLLWSIQGVRETEKYIVFNTNVGFMMMNKRSFEIQGTGQILDKKTGVRHSSFSYLAHDGDDNHILFKVDHDEWARRQPTEFNIPEHLKAQIDAVKLDENMESNPILVFYKEK